MEWSHRWPKRETHLWRGQTEFITIFIVLLLFLIKFGANRSASAIKPNFSKAKNSYLIRVFKQKRRIM